MSIYHLFAGLSYYPSGGASDYRGTYPSTLEAKDAFQHLNNIEGHTSDGYWGQIVDADDMEIMQVYGYNDDRFWRAPTEEDLERP